eukprot:EG_transcript_16373
MNGEETPLLSHPKDRHTQRYIRLAVYLAISVNLILFFAKLEACLLSRSLSIVASMLDSFLDLVSQLVLWYSHRTSSHRDKEWPVGRTRLSPVGILVCATLMFAGAVEVIKVSSVTLSQGFQGQRPTVTFDWWSISTLVSATALKIGLFVFSRHHPACARSPDVQVIADDHRNDILTNSLALSCGYLAARRRGLWWADAAGAIVLSVYIAVSWYRTGRDSMQKLVGVEADHDIVHEVTDIIARYEPENVHLDWLRCYHLGNNVVVEVEIVMPGDLTLHKTHDVAVRLQREIETISVVERAYVHVDHEHRDYDEHKHHSFPFGNDHAIEWERPCPQHCPGP